MAEQFYAENYSIRCLAGDGGQAQAFLGMREGIFYIVKIYLNPLKAEQYYKKEVEVLAKINSSRIIKLIEHYPAGRVLTWQSNVQELKPFIVMEFAEHGELFKIVRSERLSPEACRTYFKQLIEAISHLAEKELSHRDIKLQNLLLDKDFNLKLADFGMARDSKGDQNDFYLHSWLGSPSYMAPQIHQKKYKGEKLDLFASGIVLFLMYVRIPPFQNTTATNIKYNLIRQGRYQDFWAMFEKGLKRYPPPFKRLINALLSADPEKRPTLDKLSQDQWLSGPILSSEQLMAQMAPKYSRLQIRDEATRSLRAQMRQDLARIVEDHDNQMNEERERSRENQGRLEGEKKSHVFAEFLSIELQSSNLKEERVYGIPYVKASPKEVLCWLRSFLNQATKNREVFLPESLQGTEPLEHTLQATAEGEVKLQMNFELSEGSNVSQTTMILEGRFVRWGSKISVLWKGVTGHQFWLNGIALELYANLQLFFD